MKNKKYITEAIFDIDDNIFDNNISSGKLSISDISKNIVVDELYQIFNAIFIFSSRCSKYIYAKDVFNISINDNTIYVSLNAESNTNYSNGVIVITDDYNKKEPNIHFPDDVYKNFIHYLKNYKWEISLKDFEKISPTHGLFLNFKEGSIFDYNSDFALLISFIEKLYDIEKFNNVYFSFDLSLEQLSDCINLCMKYNIHNIIFNKDRINYNRDTSEIANIFKNLPKYTPSRRSLGDKIIITLKTKNVDNFGNIVEPQIIADMIKFNHDKLFYHINFYTKYSKILDLFNDNIVKPLSGVGDVLNTLRNILKQNSSLLNNYPINHLTYKGVNSLLTDDDKITLGYWMENKNISINDVCDINL